MKIPQIAVFLCVVSVLFTGCVTEKEHEEIVNQLDETRQELKDAIDAKAKAEDQLSELEVRLVGLKDERNMFSAQVDEARNHIKRLEATGARPESEDKPHPNAKGGDQFSKLEAHLTALTQERNRLSAYLAESRQEIDRMAAELAELKKPN